MTRRVSASSPIHIGATAPTTAPPGSFWYDTGATDGSGAPIATITPYAGFSTPSPDWAFCDGTALSRSTYAVLFSRVQFTVTGNATQNSATISSVSAADIAKIATGMTVEGVGIPAGTKVNTVSTSSFTMTSNATASTTGLTITVLPYGGGDGSTTFNLPDTRARMVNGSGTGRKAGSSDAVAESARAATFTHSAAALSVSASGSTDTVGSTTQSVTVSGSVSVSGSNTAESGHTHSISNPNGGTVTAGTGATTAAAAGLATHTHGGATGAGSSHNHTWSGSATLSASGTTNVQHSHANVSVSGSASSHTHTDHAYLALNHIIKVL